MAQSDGCTPSPGEFLSMVKSMRTIEPKGRVILILSVEGMNLDCMLLGFTSFFFYTLYNSYGYFFDDVETGTVDLNDCIFVYHAIMAYFICFFQALRYPKGKNKR